MHEQHALLPNSIKCKNTNVRDVSNKLTIHVEVCFFSTILLGRDFSRSIRRR
jgi:hypothetical protein